MRRLSNLLRSERWPEPIREAVSILKTIIYALLIALLPRVVLAQPFTIPSASMEPTLQEGDYIVVSKFAYGWSRYSLPFNPPVGSGRFMGRSPHRGDVVVFNLPRDQRTVYIKRLIGLPGDSLQVRHGTLFVNGVMASQSALGSAPTTCPQSFGEKIDAARYQETLPGGRIHQIAACFRGQGGANDTAVYRVPADCYFMMGDNRDNSVDSRFPPFNGPNSKAALTACPFDPKLAVALGDEEDGVGFVPFENLVGKADFVLLSWSHGASLLKPWTWVLNAQPSRWLHSIT